MKFFHHHFYNERICFSLESQIFYTLKFIHNRWNDKLKITKIDYLNQLLNEFIQIEENAKSNKTAIILNLWKTRFYYMKINLIGCHLEIDVLKDSYNLITNHPELIPKIKVIQNFKYLDEARNNLETRIVKYFQIFNYRTKIEELILKEL